MHFRAAHFYPSYSPDFAQRLHFTQRTHHRNRLDIRAGGMENLRNPLDPRDACDASKSEVSPMLAQCGITLRQLEYLRYSFQLQPPVPMALFPNQSLR